MKVLITGFDPFGNESINPAFEAIKLLPNKVLNSNIIKLELPTIFNKSIEILEKKIIEIDPDIIICVGQAGGRFKITVERVAINIDDARIKDNAGNQPIDEPIFKNGENAYFSNLPIKSIVENIKKNKIPASISNSAGSFVCNHIMYGLLYLINTKFKNKKGGFIHVPYIPEQVLNKSNMPSMSLENISKSLLIAIKTSITVKKDIKTIEGSII
ncbi:pyrrolidone-carboxylate peptidase [Tepiditoga spiralis]|uniref:Pyrrolidone-carboxylate peptidase n=1 Tax=Tepiditoga spiralis TaxID=2108365 RepID=A0A7G1G451_9BACT|nr:pyroglutamyl-peptidase I [Tepiditoga spiralis]BBE31258.1 pyrrolidone-carboxylate peptidase [Tepiditoga spiralis]